MRSSGSYLDTRSGKGRMVKESRIVRKTRMCCQTRQIRLITSRLPRHSWDVSLFGRDPLDLVKSSRPQEEGATHPPSGTRTHHSGHSGFRDPPDDFRDSPARFLLG